MQSCIQDPKIYQAPEKEVVWYFKLNVFRFNNNNYAEVKSYPPTPVQVSDMYTLVDC